MSKERGSRKLGRQEGPPSPIIQATNPPEREIVHRTKTPEREIARLAVKAAHKRTRARSGEPMTSEETDRGLRLARIATQADRVFGDRDKAARWLRKPNRTAGNQSPITLLETETGAKLVEDLLVRIEYGVIG